jgi:hypothetical protein
MRHLAPWSWHSVAASDWLEKKKPAGPPAGVPKSNCGVVYFSSKNRADLTML